MSDQTAVIAVLNHDVPLNYEYELLAQQISEKCSGVPLPLIKNYMLLAKSDHSQEMGGETLHKIVRARVIAWINEEGILDLLQATSNETDELTNRLKQCEGIDKLLLSLVFRDFLTLHEIQQCMSWTRENLVQRLKAIAEHLNGKTRA